VFLSKSYELFSLILAYTLNIRGGSTSLTPQVNIFN